MKTIQLFTDARNGGQEIVPGTMLYQVSTGYANFSDDVEGFGLSTAALVNAGIADARSTAVIELYDSVHWMTKMVSDLMRHSGMSQEKDVMPLPYDVSQLEMSAAELVAAVEEKRLDSLTLPDNLAECISRYMAEATAEGDQWIEQHQESRGDHETRVLRFNDLVESRGLTLAQVNSTIESICQVSDVARQELTDAIGIAAGNNLRGTRSKKSVDSAESRFALELSKIYVMYNVASYIVCSRQQCLVVYQHANGDARIPGWVKVVNEHVNESNSRWLTVYNARLHSIHAKPAKTQKPAKAEVSRAPHTFFARRPGPDSPPFGPASTGAATPPDVMTDLMLLDGIVGSEAQQNVNQYIARLSSLLGEIIKAGVLQKELKQFFKVQDECRIPRSLQKLLSSSGCHQVENMPCILGWYQVSLMLVQSCDYIMQDIDGWQVQYWDKMNCEAKGPCSAAVAEKSAIAVFGCQSPSVESLKPGFIALEAIEAEMDVVMKQRSICHPSEWFTILPNWQMMYRFGYAVLAYDGLSLRQDLAQGIRDYARAKADKLRVGQMSRVSGWVQQLLDLEGSVVAENDIEQSALAGCSP